MSHSKVLLGERQQNILKILETESNAFMAALFYGMRCSTARRKYRTLLERSA